MLLLSIGSCDLDRLNLDQVELLNFETTIQTFENIAFDYNEQVGFQQLDTSNYVLGLADNNEIKQYVFRPFETEEDDFDVAINESNLTYGYKCNDLIRDNNIIIDFEFDGVVDIEFDFGLGNEEVLYFSKDWNGDGIDDIGYRKNYFFRIDTNFDGEFDLIHYYKGD